ncbi:MAG TPA: gluconeogenesis factor YvcK family protein [Acidobacteriota bacterium]|jgi:uncharacterized cofD-like protein
MLRIIGIGGGTGLAVTLSGLKKLAQNSDLDPQFTRVGISAVVSVADNGGSSGLLRDNLGIPAVGDLRNCVIALCADNPLLANLFRHRFSRDTALQGHSLGNLILAALCQQSGSLGQAIKRASRLLHAKGSIFPVTETLVTLCAEFENGTVARGEVQIPAARRKIKRVWLEPEDAPPFPAALRAIARADVLVLGPGSLYTSVVPNLLVPGVVQAIQASNALKVFVCNLMTEPGETENFSAGDHLRVLETYLGRKPVDVCILNSTPLPPDLVSSYLNGGSEPVAWKKDDFAGMGITPVVADLAARVDGVIRHDPVRLARSILSAACDVVPARRLKTALERSEALAANG